MPHFIDINRLDYAKNSNICLKKEFDSLRLFHKNYRHKAAEFIIRNNLTRYSHHHSAFFTAVRVYFTGIWEWHTPEEIDKIISGIHCQYLANEPDSWDCVWMLKEKTVTGETQLYADIIFFWRSAAHARSLVRWAEELPDSEFIQVEILFQSSRQETNLDDLHKLCLPEKNCTMLQCRFASETV